MACPRARFIKVLAEMNCQGDKFEKLITLFDFLYPAEKPVHDAEIQIAKMDREVERRVADRRTGPSIEGTEIAVITKIEPRDS